MLRALRAVKEEVSVRQTVKVFGVLRLTLVDQVKGRVTHRYLTGPVLILSDQDEDALVQYCLYKPWVPSH